MTMTNPTIKVRQARQTRREKKETYGPFELECVKTEEHISYELRFWRDAIKRTKQSKVNQNCDGYQEEVNEYLRLQKINNKKLTAVRKRRRQIEYLKSHGWEMTSVETEEGIVDTFKNEEGSIVQITDHHKIKFSNNCEMRINCLQEFMDYINASLKLRDVDPYCSNQQFRFRRIYDFGYDEEYKIDE